MQLSLLNRTTLFSLLLAFAGCREEARIDRGTESLQPLQSDTATITTYPRARWRLVNPVEDLLTLLGGRGRFALRRHDLTSDELLRHGPRFLIGQQVCMPGVAIERPAPFARVYGVAFGAVFPQQR